MSSDSTIPNIVSDDTAESLSIPELAVEYAEILAFETMVKDLVATRKATFAERVKIAQDETGGKTFQARNRETNDVMVDFTIKESKAEYKVTDRDAFTDWVLENHGSEIAVTATITDQAAFTEWARENTPEWAKVTLSVQPAYEKGLLGGKTFSRDGDTIIETDTGLLVDGIAWVPAHSLGILHPTWKPGGKELAARAVIAGAADRLLSGFLAETARELEPARDPAA